MDGERKDGLLLRQSRPPSLRRSRIDADGSRRAGRELHGAVSCVIEDKYTELAVRALHDAFELGRDRA